MRNFALVTVGVILAAGAAESGELRKTRNRVPNSYIVVLKDPAPGSFQTAAVRSLAENHAAIYGGRTRHVYQHALRGYSVDMTEGQAAQLALDPDVAYVEENGVVSVNATQTGATWGLDRIDQRTLPLSTTYTYDFDGTGVHAYVVDTGVRLSHIEFTGRAGNGFTAINDANGTNDCHGHGTHVAGTIGGTTYGVAKRATIHPVRVLGCTGQGTNAGVVAGVDWVRANHVKPAVANMSLGGGISTAVDQAVTNAVSAGVTFVVAAGNSNANACNGSPSRVPVAITVGSTTNADARSSFSNFGTCVDIFAPGSGITSAWATSNTAISTISGTSMASPHVAGVAALYLQQNPQAAPAAVASALVANATLDRLTSIGAGSPNRLLHSIFGGPVPTATPTPTLPPRPTPTPTPGAVVEVTPGASGVTASAHDGNVPANVVDNNLSTRWSASGTGQWLQLDLGTTRNVAFVRVGVYNGTGRRNIFNLELSETGLPGSWTTVFSGQTPALTLQEQTIEFPDRPARYVRYVGNGNTDTPRRQWNSVTELSVFATP